MRIFIGGVGVEPRNWSHMLQHRQEAKAYYPHVDAQTNGGERVSRRAPRPRLGLGVANPDTNPNPNPDPNPTPTPTPNQAVARLDLGYAVTLQELVTVLKGRDPYGAPGGRSSSHAELVARHSPLAIHIYIYIMARKSRTKCHCWRVPNGKAQTHGHPNPNPKAKPTPTGASKHQGSPTTELPAYHSCRKKQLVEYSGVFYYHRGRLIAPLQALPCFSKADNRLPTAERRIRDKGFGLLGVCRENFLTPRHNKASYMLRETVDSAAPKPELLFKRMSELANPNPIPDPNPKPNPNLSPNPNQVGARGGAPVHSRSTDAQCDPRPASPQQQQQPSRSQLGPASLHVGTQRAATSRLSDEAHRARRQLLRRT